MQRLVTTLVLGIAFGVATTAGFGVGEPRGQTLAQSSALMSLKADAGLLGPVRTIVKSEASFGEDHQTIDDAVPTLTHISEFDRNGNLTKVLKYSSNGSLSKSTDFDFAENGYLRSVVEYSRDGTILVKIVGSHDDERNIVEITAYDSDDLVLRLGELVYDGAGRIVEVRVYETDRSLLGRIAYTFDSEGRQIREDSYDKDGLKSSRQWDWTSAPESTKSIITESDGSVYLRSSSTHQFEYDGKGNWTKKVTRSEITLSDSEDVMTASATYRVFSYYP